MTTRKITLPGVDDDTNDLINGLLDQLEAHNPRNLLRASYYDGKHAVRAVGSIIPPQYWKLGIVLGWAAKAVDALARRCHLDGFVWPDGNLDDIGGTEIWDDNHLGSEIDSGLVSSLQHGPAFLINTIGDDALHEPRSLIHIKSATNATGEWNPRRRTLDNLLSITDRRDGKVTELVLYLDGLTLRAQRDTPTSTWQVEQSEHAYGVPAEVLPYRPTVAHPFGSSRITRPIMSLQDRATAAVVRLEAHSDIYAIPDLWMFGADESIFKNADGSQKASWQVLMGRIKAIPDDDEAANPRAEAKQFPATSPAPHLSALNAYAKMFARESSLPDNAVAITDVSNPTSAESYDASQYELISEAEGATDDWTPALRKSYVRSLAIANGVKIDDVPTEWSSIDTKWRNPRYLSRAAQADAGMKQLTAIPWLAETEVGLELLGLDPQQIRRALADRRRAQGRGVLDALTAAASQANRDASGRSAT